MYNVKNVEDTIINKEFEILLTSKNVGNDNFDLFTSGFFKTMSF